MTRTYGWKPDRADPRDHVYSAPRRFFGLPRRVDLRASCSPVEDQGALGSCTGNASVAALEFLEVKAGKKLVDLSRLMAYYNGRVLELTVKEDAGAEIRDVVHQLAVVGTCAEWIWPYDPRRFAVKPSQAAYKDALTRRVNEFARVVGLQQLRACLAEGYPVIFGFTVYESFEGDAVARTGILSMPKAHEREMGGHAVLAVGYDDGDRTLIVRNSWGPNWGLRGYFRMPYGYVENASLSDDFWTIRK